MKLGRKLSAVAVAAALVVTGVVAEAMVVAVVAGAVTGVGEVGVAVEIVATAATAGKLLLFSKKP